MGALTGALMVAVAWLAAAALGSEDSPPDHDATGSPALASTAPPTTTRSSTEEPAEMLRREEMTAQEATTLWLQSWRQGNDEVRAYRAAARAAKGKTC